MHGASERSSGQRPTQSEVPLDDAETALLGSLLAPAVAGPFYWKLLHNLRSVVPDGVADFDARRLMASVAVMLPRIFPCGRCRKNFLVHENVYRVGVASELGALRSVDGVLKVGTADVGDHVLFHNDFHLAWVSPVAGVRTGPPVRIFRLAEVNVRVKVLEDGLQILDNVAVESGNVLTHPGEPASDGALVGSLHGRDIARTPRPIHLPHEVGTVAMVDVYKEVRFPQDTGGLSVQSVSRIPMLSEDYQGDEPDPGAHRRTAAASGDTLAAHVASERSSERRPGAGVLPMAQLRSAPTQAEIEEACMGRYLLMIGSGEISAMPTTSDPTMNRFWLGGDMHEDDYEEYLGFAIAKLHGIVVPDESDPGRDPTVRAVRDATMADWDARVTMEDCVAAIRLFGLVGRWWAENNPLYIQGTPVTQAMADTMLMHIFESKTDIEARALEVYNEINGSSLEEVEPVYLSKMIFSLQSISYMLHYQAFRSLFGRPTDDGKWVPGMLTKKFPGTTPPGMPLTSNNVIGTFPPFSRDILGLVYRRLPSSVEGNLETYEMTAQVKPSEVRAAIRSLVDIAVRGGMQLGRLNVDPVHVSARGPAGQITMPGKRPAGAAAGAGATAGSAAGSAAASAAVTPTMLKKKTRLTEAEFHGLPRVGEAGIRLLPSRIPGAGLGVFTERAIPAGTIVTGYTGQLLDREQTEAREAAGLGSHLRMVERGRSTEDGRINPGVLAKDGRPVGAASFVNDANNHGAFPATGFRNNSELLAVTINGVEYHTVLATIVDVPAGSELFASYGSEYWKRVKQRLGIVPVEESGEESDEESDEEAGAAAVPEVLAAPVTPDYGAGYPRDVSAPRATRARR